MDKNKEIKEEKNKKEKKINKKKKKEEPIFKIIYEKIKIEFD